MVTYHVLLTVKFRDIFLCMACAYKLNLHTSSYAWCVHTNKFIHTRTTIIKNHIALKLKSTMHAGRGVIKPTGVPTFPPLLDSLSELYS